MDDLLIFAVDQCFADIPAQLDDLRDGGQTVLSGRSLQDLLKAGEQFHPHKEGAGQPFSPEIKILYGDNIGGSSQCLHDLDLTAERVRNIIFRPLLVILVHGQDHCGIRAAHLDDLEGRIHPDPEIVPVDLKDITEGSAAQPAGHMPFRPHISEFLFDDFAFYIIVIHNLIPLRIKKGARRLFRIDRSSICLHELYFFRIFNRIAFVMLPYSHARFFPFSPK